MQKIIWIVGPPRSGTTWVGKELARRFGYTYEHEPFHPGNQPPWSPVAQQYHTEIERNEDLSKYLNSRINNKGEYLKWRLKRGIIRDRLYYMKKYVDGLRSHGIVVKDPHLSLLSHQLIAIFPNSTIVWVHRNKVDHLDSLEKKGWKYDVEQLLKNKIDFITDSKKAEMVNLIGNIKTQRDLNALGYDIFQAYRSFYTAKPGQRMIVAEYDRIIENKDVELKRLTQQVKSLSDPLH